MKTFLTSLLLFATILASPAQYRLNSVTTNSQPAMISFITGLVVNPTNGITIAQATNAANLADTVVSNALSARLIATNNALIAADTVVSNGLNTRLLNTNTALITAYGSADTVVSNGLSTRLLNTNTALIAADTIVSNGLSVRLINTNNALLFSNALNASSALLSGSISNGQIAVNTINSNKLDAATRAMFGTGGGGGGSGGNILTTNIASLTPSSGISIVQGDIAGTRSSYIDMLSGVAPHIEVGGDGWFQVDVAQTNSQYLWLSTWLHVVQDVTIEGTLNAGNQVITTAAVQQLVMNGLTNKYLFVGTNEVVVGVDSVEGNGNALTNLNGTEIRSGTVADARIASTITRDSEWDTVAEINAATGRDILTNGRTSVVTLNSNVTFNSGTRTWIHDSTRTSSTNSATLTSWDVSSGLLKAWYNGTATVLIDVTNGSITANSLNFSGVLSFDTLVVSNPPAFNLSASTNLPLSGLSTNGLTAPTAGQLLVIKSDGTITASNAPAASANSTNGIISGATFVGASTNAAGAVHTGGRSETNYATGNWNSTSNAISTWGPTNAAATVTITGSSGNIAAAGTLNLTGVATAGAYVASGAGGFITGTGGYFSFNNRLTMYSPAQRVLALCDPSGVGFDLLVFGAYFTDNLAQGNQSTNWPSMRINSTNYPSISFRLGTNVTAGVYSSVFVSNVTASASVLATNGIASFSTISTASLAATGWTNTFNVNATAYVTATAISFVIKDRSQATLYTSPTLTTTLPVILQPGWAITAASGLTGTALPF